MLQKIKFMMIAAILFTHTSYGWEDIQSGMGILASNDITGKHQVILYCVPDSGMILDIDEEVAASLEINGQAYDDLNTIANKIDELTSLKVNGHDIPVDGLSKFKHFLVGCKTE